MKNILLIIVALLYIGKLYAISDSTNISSIEIYVQSKSYTYSTTSIFPYLNLVSLCKSSGTNKNYTWYEIITSKERILDFNRIYSGLKKPSFFKRIFSVKYKNHALRYQPFICVIINFENGDSEILILTSKRKIIWCDHSIFDFNENMLSFLLLNSTGKIRQELYEFYGLVNITDNNLGTHINENSLRPKKQINELDSIRDHPEEAGQVLGNTRLTFIYKNANGVVDVTNNATTNEILQEI